MRYAKVAAVAVGLPAAAMLWALGFIAASFASQTAGSAVYIGATAILAAALAEYLL